MQRERESCINGERENERRTKREEVSKFELNERARYMYVVTVNSPTLSYSRSCTSLFVIFLGDNQENEPPNTKSVANRNVYGLGSRYNVRVQYLRIPLYLK